jgi:fructokinase
MYDVVALGEVLIDFTPAGTSAGGQRLFEQNPGGAPANVLTALANLGKQVAIVGKVGADMHGDFLRAVLRSKNIDDDGLLSDPRFFTTLAFVSLSPAGEREFAFARKPGADTELRAEELPTAKLENCRVFHFGSLSLTDEPARSATRAALTIARRAGAIISYDPNYRAPVWASAGAAIAQVRSVVGEVDLMKISDEEVELLTGKTELAAGAEKLLAQGVKCVVITRGKDGAEAFTARHRAAAPTAPVKVVDTTGAGDAFWGGFLAQVLDAPAPLAELSAPQLQSMIKFANAVAACCVQKRGAIPAMPTLAEVRAALMKDN